MHAPQAAAVSLSPSTTPMQYATSYTLLSVMRGALQYGSQ